MIDGLVFILTLLALLGCGLVAGIFFAFSTFIMKALGKIPAPQGIAAMQSINIVVINPWFLTAFFGTAVVCLALTLVAVLGYTRSGTGLLLAGSLFYLVGTILVTMACNVPRNNALATVEQESAEGAQLWEGYLQRWTFWNHVRTLASLVAAAMFALAL